MKEPGTGAAAAHLGKRKAASVASDDMKLCQDPFGVCCRRPTKRREPAVKNNGNCNQCRPQGEIRRCPSRGGPTTRREKLRWNHDYCLSSSLLDHTDNTSSGFTQLRHDAERRRTTNSAGFQVQQNATGTSWYPERKRCGRRQEGARAPLLSGQLSRSEGWTIMRFTSHTCLRSAHLDSY